MLNLIRVMQVPVMPSRQKFLKLRLQVLVIKAQQRLT